MDRRKFISRFTPVALGASGILGMLGIARITYPGTGTRTRTIRAGRPDDFPLHTFTLLEDKGLFIYRDHVCTRAVSATCTHLGCRLQKTGTGFRCPCHGSEFDKQGVVLSGPAPRNLDWLKMEFDYNGYLVVKPDQIVSPDTYLQL